MDDIAIFHDVIATFQTQQTLLACAGHRAHPIQGAVAHDLGPDKAARQVRVHATRRIQRRLPSTKLPGAHLLLTGRRKERDIVQRSVPNSHQVIESASPNLELSGQYRRFLGSELCQVSLQLGAHRHKRCAMTLGVRPHHRGQRTAIRKVSFAHIGHIDEGLDREQVQPGERRVFVLIEWLPSQPAALAQALGQTSQSGEVSGVFARGGLGAGLNALHLALDKV